MKLLFLVILGVSTCTLGAIVPRPKEGAEDEDTFMEPVGQQISFKISFG